MRLIDADEIVKDLLEQIPLAENVSIFKDIIESQPTAFDIDKVAGQLKEVSNENTGMGGDYLDDAIKVIRTRELNCDETQEIRTVLKRMHEILDEAIETNACGNENELSGMVEAYLPNIEQSYKYFIERMMGVKHE